MRESSLIGKVFVASGICLILLAILAAPGAAYGCALVCDSGCAASGPPPCPGVGAAPCVTTGLYCAAPPLCLCGPDRLGGACRCA